MEDLKRKYTALIVYGGILHLYESSDDFCKDFQKWKRDSHLSIIAWLEKTIIHEKGCYSEEANNEGD